MAAKVIIILSFLLAFASLATLWTHFYNTTRAEARARPVVVTSTPAHAGPNTGLASLRQPRLDSWFKDISRNLPRATTRLFSRLGSHACVLDVGANVGAFAKRVLDTCPTCSVHAFEAMHQYADYIRSRFGSQYGDRLHVAPFGLSDRKKQAMLYYDDSNLGWNTIHKTKTSNPGKMEQFETGDAYVEKLGLGRIDLIKIDTEGAEHEVLRGLRKTLARRHVCRPTLLIELGWGTSHPEIGKVKEELEYLYSLGYARVPRLPSGTEDVILHGTCDKQ